MGSKGMVSAAFPLLLSLFLFNAPFPHLTRADGTVGIVCYGYNGLSYVNNTKCPGSNACCGYQATCVSNRLCHNPGDAEGTYVRGPCANNIWDSTCAQVCLFNETEALAGFLPRVSQCGDGSWCCVNDATCCSNGRGVFLDSDGILPWLRAQRQSAILLYPVPGWSVIPSQPPRRYFRRHPQPRPRPRPLYPQSHHRLPLRLPLHRRILGPLPLQTPPKTMTTTLTLRSASVSA